MICKRGIPFLGGNPSILDPGKRLVILFSRREESKYFQLWDHIDSVPTIQLCCSREDAIDIGGQLKSAGHSLTILDLVKQKSKLRSNGGHDLLSWSERYLERMRP